MIIGNYRAEINGWSFLLEIFQRKPETLQVSLHPMKSNSKASLPPEKFTAYSEDHAKETASHMVASRYGQHVHEWIKSS
jgi:hypothetical protein